MMQGVQVLSNDRHLEVQQAVVEGEADVQKSRTANARELLKIYQLIDLTAKPIQLKRDHIGWSQVRANASNCICCCANSSITLVTTNDSYVLDHIPLDDVQSAEANPTLAYLAMSNQRKLAVIDLVENNIALSGCSSGGSGASASSRRSVDFAGKLRTSTKVVNLASADMSISDVILWRWIDESVLAILTQEALFTCEVNQTRISHPATSALSQSPQLLSIEKVCDLHPSLAGFCQITSIQRDQSSNLYAITGLYLPSDYSNWTPAAELKQATPQQARRPISVANRRMANFSSSPLKHSFSSVPNRLSQLAKNDRSFDSLASLEKYTDLNNNDNNSKAQVLSQPEAPFSDEVCGLVQIHCRMRDRSQVIPAQAAAFATSYAQCDTQPESTSTTLIVANRAEDKLRVHFIGMATTSDLSTNGQNAAPSKRFNSFPGDNKFDFPTSIVCCPLGDSASHITQESSIPDQLAMVTSKYGQLFVCSIQHGTILFNVRICHEVISSTVLESRTNSLMAICRNGQVILVQVDREKVCNLLEDKSLRLMHSFQALDSFRTGRKRISAFKRNVSVDSIANKIDSLNIGLNVIESTKF